MTASFGTLARTLIHLRPRQLASQAWVRLIPGWNDPSWIACRRPPPWPGIRWRPRVPWMYPSAGANIAPEAEAGRLTFVNQTHDLGDPLDWDAASMPLLWRYNVHYLDWVWALPLDKAIAVAVDWVLRHPPVPAAVGWSPYPTSLRLLNFCLLADARPDRAESLWPSIWQQAEHLSRRLEWHLLGNHLLENGIALALVGNCFAGAEADRWRAIGQRILALQIPEQVLPDGTHFERSPMYHSRLTYALGLVANGGDETIRKIVTEPLRRMIDALLTLSHPDGEIALFNDSAFGIAPPPPAVASFASAVVGEGPAIAPDHLSHGGYYTGRTLHGDYFVCDAGPLGPDYLPGHAHGDIFSFELSLGSHRMVVDSGTFDYMPTEMRRYCRSTAAHNTVTIRGADQAEFWGTFRVGRRGRPHDVKWEACSDGFQIEAWHDGYRHLSGSPTHHRRYRWYDDGRLTIEDHISARRAVSAVSRIHLHPECRATAVDNGSIIVERGAVNAAVRFREPIAPRLEEGWYCPEFGIRRRCVVIVADAVGADVRLDCTIVRRH